MRFSICLLFIVCLLTLAHPAQAKTCLVLSGGGALGIAHVGVLKVLEENHVPIDCITGTSMGAIVGGLYASGYSADELEKLVKTSHWATLFRDSGNRQDFTFQRKRDDLNFLMNYRIGINSEGGINLPKGAIRGNQIDLAFLEFTLRSQGITDFDKLPIPFRAVATNVETGDAVVLKGGNLVRSMRASMSVPGVFAPVAINDKYLVDGGASNNLPIDVARSMGATHVIAVHIPTILRSYDDLSSALAVAGQMISILIKQNEDRQIPTLTKTDVYIRPDIKGFTSSDFNRADQLVEPGIIAANNRKQELSALSVDKDEYNAIRKRQYRPAPEAPIISFVELKNNSNLKDDIVKQRISLKPGERLSMAAMQQDLSRLRGTGHFETVTFDIVEQPNQEAGIIMSVDSAKNTQQNPSEATPDNSDNSEKTRGVSILAEAKQWSEDNVRFGLNLQDNFEGTTAYNLSARYSRTMLNDLGGEFNLDGQIGENNLIKGELYQPLSVDHDYFIATSGGYDGRNIPILEGKQQVAEYRLTRTKGRVDAGRTLFGDDAEARIGLERGFGYANLKTGDIPSRIDNHFDIGAFVTTFDYDTLDQVGFPRDGEFGNLTYRQSSETLGATDDFKQAEGRLTWAETWGRNTFLFTSSWQLSLEEDTPIEGQFLSGGFLNFSGYQNDQIFSPNIANTRVMAYHQLIGDSTSIFSLPVYVGGSAEVGDFTERRQDLYSQPIFSGSTFVGTETLFGPVYLAYGQSEGGIRSVYLFLGRTF